MTGETRAIKRHRSRREGRGGGATGPFPPPGVTRVRLRWMWGHDELSRGTTLYTTCITFGLRVRVGVRGTLRASSRTLTRGWTHVGGRPHSDVSPISVGRMMVLVTPISVTLLTSTT